MSSLIPFGTAFINPDHVVSVTPDRVTPDGVCLITVFMTSGPVITYEVPGGKHASGPHPRRRNHPRGGGTVRRPTAYTIILGCYAAVLAVLGAGLWMGDERWAWAGLALFTGLCVVSAFLITLNEH